MQSFVIGFLSVLVIISSVFYFGVTTIILCKLSLESTENRRFLALPLLPSFFQNYGIPLVILGLALRMSNLMVFGGLLISLAILLRRKDSVSIHPAMEIPLLIIGLIATVGMGALYALSYFGYRF
jgi:hypothetical protein